MNSQSPWGVHVQVLRDDKIFTDPESGYNSISSATDGDLDAAYAMLLAGQRWREPSYTDRGIKVWPSNAIIVICHAAPAVLPF